MTNQKIQMSLAVAEAIVEKREVTWLKYSDGTDVVPGPVVYSF